MGKRWNCCIFMVFGLGFFSVLAGAQTTVDLTPDRDNTIFNNDTDGSNGAGARLFIGTTSGSVPGSQRRALLRFDVSGFPFGSTITNATLSLTQVSATPPTSATSTVAAHRLLVEFGEGASLATGAGGGVPATAIPPDATWVHRITSGSSTTGTAWGFGGGQAGTDYVAGATAFDANGTGTVTLNVTSDVQAWVDGVLNRGWILVGSTTFGSVRGYGSRENTTAANRPVLSVSYLGPVDLTISKIDAMDPVEPNNNIVYTIIVSNIGESTATGTITVADDLDDDTTFVSASGSGWACSTGDQFTCTRESDLAGGGMTPAITVIAMAPGGDMLVTNSVSVSTPDIEISTGNNGALQTTTVAANPNVIVRDGFED